MSKQLMRSGTSIGPIAREAKEAESNADFIHKLAIAKKATSESEYWIELLRQSGYIEKQQFISIFSGYDRNRKTLEFYNYNFQE